MKVHALTTRGRKSRRSGFTLIELVMVIMILAIVAGLTVPIVGWLRRSANYGAQANTAAGVGSNLELFRTTYGNNGYPDGLDSLIMTGTTDVMTNANSEYLDHGFRFLTPGDLTDDEAASFNWLSTIYDHEVLANKHAGLQGSPGNSANYARPFTGENVAIAYDPAVGLLDPATVGPEQGRLLRQIYPDNNADGAPDVPADVKLVAFGIGPNNEMIGRTMQNVPMDPRVDPSEVYGRYVAIFACYDPRAGRRAQLKAVLNAFGRTNNDALSEFWQAQNPE